MNDHPSRSAVPESREDVERRIAATLARAGIDATAVSAETERELHLLNLVRDLRALAFRQDERLRHERIDGEAARARAQDLDAELRRLARDHAVQITALAAIRAGLEDRVGRVQNDAAGLREHATRLENLLRDLLRSTSWRAMRPVRVLLEGLRGRRWREPSVPVPVSVDGAADTHVMHDGGVSRKAKET